MFQLGFQKCLVRVQRKLSSELFFFAILQLNSEFANQRRKTLHRMNYSPIVKYTLWRKVASQICQNWHRLFGLKFSKDVADFGNSKKCTMVKIWYSKTPKKSLKLGIEQLTYFFLDFSPHDFWSTVKNCMLIMFKVCATFCYQFPCLLFQEKTMKMETENDLLLDLC